MTTNETTIYRIAPISRADFDLAGEGNEWIIYERTDGGGYRRV